MSTTLIKVLHIASGDLWAGAEAQLFTLCTALSSQQVDVSVVLLNHGELETRLSENNIPVTIIDESLYSPLKIVRLLTKHIQEIKPTIVHTHRSKENVLGSISSKLAGNIPSLRTTHGAAEIPIYWIKLYKHIPAFFNWISGYFIQKKIIAVSSDLAIILGKKFPISKISTIENGVDVTAIGMPKLEFLKTNNSPLKVGFIGRLVSVKRVDIFIATAKYWAVHYPSIPAEFHIYGNGPLLDELIQLTKTLGISDKVYFRGHCSKIYQHLVNLDFLLITSNHEGLPMTLLEAMTLGVPIISSAVGGIPHALSGGDCGVLISKQVEKDYADAIHNCIINKENTLKMIHNAKEKIKQSYTAKANALKHKAIYQEIVNDNKKHTLKITK